MKRFVCILFLFLTSVGCYMEQEIQVTQTVVTVTSVKKLNRVSYNDSERYLVTLEDRGGVKYYMFFYEVKAKVGEKFTVLMIN